MSPITPAHHDPTAPVAMQPREILRLLETVPLLADMTTRERAVLAEMAEVTRCARDVVLLSPGQEVRWWYLILNGTVLESVRAPDGTWPAVREAGAGECMGLDAVLLSQPATVQATSVTPCSFVRVRANDFQALLRGTSPTSVKLAAAMHQALAQDLRAATKAMMGFQV